MLINFADSAFAIGESLIQPESQPAENLPTQQQNPLRYLKQVKQRSGTETYGSQNVCLLKLVRHESFLHFEFTGNAQEQDHLRRYSQQPRDRHAHQVAALLSEGLSQRQIAAKLKLSLGMVNKFARGLEA
ncbi:MAG: hypothetical protein EOP49_13395 [Sphingobacteriales bacterium]|nr:MAG: hypothetical protein EOP49_13395 [Sphingobacteriales bacterium]